MSHNQVQPTVQGVIYDRFRNRDLEWRLCYKALLLSEFLIKKGPMVSFVPTLNEGISTIHFLPSNCHARCSQSLRSKSTLDKHPHSLNCFL